MIAWNRHCIKSKKKGMRLRHKIGNLRLPDLQYFKVSKRKLYSIIRAINRVYRVL